MKSDIGFLHFGRVLSWNVESYIIDCYVGMSITSKCSLHFWIEASYFSQNRKVEQLQYLGSSLSIRTILSIQPQVTGHARGCFERQLDEDEDVEEASVRVDLLWWWRCWKAIGFPIGNSRLMAIRVQLSWLASAECCLILQERVMWIMWIWRCLRNLKPCYRCLQQFPNCSLSTLVNISQHSSQPFLTFPEHSCSMHFSSQFFRFENFHEFLFSSKK